MRFKPLVLASAIVLACASQVAWAECYGFTDTNVTVESCNAIEWLRNRSITLGCGGTNFCPEDLVKREHMALFLNRLGKALTPIVLYTEQPTGNYTIAASDGTSLVCIVGPLNLGAGSFPHMAHALGQFYAYPTDGPAQVQARFKFSVNSGLTWQFVGGAGALSSKARAEAGQLASTSALAAPLALVPGTSYLFAMGLDGMGAEVPVSSMGCQVRVTIDNANAATSPLDE